MDSGRTVVVDAGAVIHGARLERYGSRAVTTAGVFKEIKDKQAKLLIHQLPFEIQVKEPTQNDILAIRAFARKTGDLGVLSTNDIAIAALTRQLHREAGGESSLRTEPGQIDITNDKARFAWGPTLVTGQEPSASSQEPAKCDNQCDDASDDEKKETETEKNVATDSKSSAACDTKPEGAAAVKDEDDVGAEALGNMHIKGDDEEEEEEEDSQEEDGSDDESAWSEDGSDAGEWVTPDNVHRMGVASEKIDNDVKVALVTGDYSVQNVALQMGLAVMTFDGYAVRNVKVWGVICRACHEFSRDSTKMFCQKCGNAGLQRVPISVDGDGNVKLHDNKRAPRLKGTIYPIPKPKHGKAGRMNDDILLREDQLLMGGRERMMRHKKKLAEKEMADHAVDSDLFTTQGWWSRATTKTGKQRDDRTKMEFGFGRRNPNANNFRKKKR